MNDAMGSDDIENDVIASDVIERGVIQKGHYSNAFKNRNYVQINIIKIWDLNCCKSSERYSLTNVWKGW